jgi:hypothetical protein
MGNNYLQVELGGQKRGLKFVIGTIYTVRDADILAKEYEGKVVEEMRQLAIVTYGALLSNYRSLKKEQDFTFADVLDWCENMESIDEASKIAQMFSRLTNSSAPVEGGGNTQFQAVQSAGLVGDRTERAEAVA